MNAIHFNDLFGMDLTNKFNAMPFEIREAKRLYDEYNEYRNNRAPGEEYELVQHWGEDIRLEKYFELINEVEYRNRRTNVDELLTSIENDPFELKTNQEFKQKEMQAFQDTAKEMGLNMAVVMFMVDALKYFENLTKEKTKEIAFEIAMVGTQGINPSKGNNYKLKNIPNKSFSGYHLLGYYYVSWAIAIPEMLKQLQLPYDSEYEMAKKMFEGGMK